MIDTQSSTPAAETAGASAESTSSNDSGASAAQQALSATPTESAKSVADAVREKIGGADSAKGASKVAPDAKAAAAQAGAPEGTTAVVTPDGKVAYVPNFKYKVAGQEKELDEFWRPLVKDADSEKKVKELFTKVDAFDFVKGKKEHIEQQYNSLTQDYQAVSSLVNRFDQSLAAGDLSSAFRIAGIPKEAIFKWVNQQLQYMELPPEQRAQIDAAENARMQQMEIEEKFSRMENQYQTQAVQARTMQLDLALMKPEVASFAAAWDQTAEPGFTFRDTVASEARRVWYESGQKTDLSPEQAVALVMSKFGRFVNGAQQAPTAQPPQAANQVAQRQATPPPVIPNVTGKAASPIKKVPKSIDDLRAIAKSMS